MKVSFKNLVLASSLSLVALAMACSKSKGGGAAAANPVQPANCYDADCSYGHQYDQGLFITRAYGYSEPNQYDQTMFLRLAFYGTDRYRDPRDVNDSHHMYPYEGGIGAIGQVEVRDDDRRERGQRVSRQCYFDDGSYQVQSFEPREGSRHTAGWSGNNSGTQGNFGQLHLRLSNGQTNIEGWFRDGSVVYSQDEQSDDDSQKLTPDGRRDLTDRRHDGDYVQRINRNELQGAFHVYSVNGRPCKARLNF